MKVLLINSVCGVGSTGRICTDIYSQLKEQGHECKIAYGRKNSFRIDKKDTYRIGNKFDLLKHVILTRITDRHGFYSKRATKKFINWIKEYKPDIINLHNIHGYYLNIKLLFNFLEEYKKPVIWTLHDCWSFTGHCYHFQQACCNKWKTENGCYKCSERKSYPTSLLLDNSKKNFKDKKNLFTSLNNLTIVTPSKWLADLVKESYLKDNEVLVINNGIDLGVFKHIESNIKIKLGLENKKIVLGVAAPWSEKKGINDFIKLSKILPDEYKIVLVGVSEQIEKKLPISIVSIRHTNNIQELAELYSCAEVFLNLSHEENYPTVNLEALACGTPVIAYDCGGSLESAFINKEDGIKEYDLEEIKQRIINKDYRSISFAKEDISKNTMIEKYISLYNTKTNGE